MIKEREYGKTIMKPTIRKKVTKVTIQATNEQALLLQDHKIYRNAGKQFVKVYTDENNYTIVDQLKPAELKIYVYIIHHLKINRKSITLHKSYFNYSDPTYYKAIKKLIEWDIIDKTGSNNYYLINTDHFFNGKI